MLVRKRTLPLLIAIGTMSPVVAACGDDGPTGPIFTDPAIITVQNELSGPVLFFRARACGTTDWGDDLLPPDPIEGTIQSGESKDITVEAGCYDLQAQALPGTDPSPVLITLEIFDIQVTALQGFTWLLMEDPEPA